VSEAPSVSAGASGKAGNPSEKPRGLRRLLQLLLFLLAAALIAWDGSRLADRLRPRAFHPDLRPVRTVTPKDPQCVRFLCTGDVRSQVGMYRPIAAEARRQGVDFVLLLGDAVPTAEERAFAQVFEELRRAGPNPPWFFLTGNHDVDDGGAVFARAVGAPVYTIEAGGLRLLCLDNGAYKLSEASWDLVRGAGPGQGVCSVVACHIPLKEEDGARIAAAIPVAAFLWAHAHKGYRELSLAGKPAWEVPGGGAHIGPEERPFAAIVEYSERDGKLSVKKIGLEDCRSPWEALPVAYTVPLGVPIGLGFLALAAAARPGKAARGAQRAGAWLRQTGRAVAARAFRRRQR